jgi:hypothetical protein
VDEEGDEGAAEQVVYEAVKGLEVEDGGGDAEEEGGKGAESGEDLGGGRVERVSWFQCFGLERVRGGGRGGAHASIMCEGVGDDGVEQEG